MQRNERFAMERAVWRSEPLKGVMICPLRMLDDGMLTTTASNTSFNSYFCWDYGYHLVVGAGFFASYALLQPDRSLQSAVSYYSRSTLQTLLQILILVSSANSLSTLSSSLDMQSIP